MYDIQNGCISSLSYLSTLSKRFPTIGHRRISNYQGSVRGWVSAWMGVYAYQIISLLVGMESARQLSVISLCAVKTFLCPASVLWCLS